MKFQAGLIALLLALAGGSSAPLAKTGGFELSVMTRNQYFGGDLIAVAAAPDAASFIAAARAVLLEMAANNFPERAQALAREIADRRPHIVALQEVAQLKLNDVVTGQPPFVDQLSLTLDALKALGASYVAVASVRNLTVALPVDLSGDGEADSFVSFMDRDVILARKDIVDAGFVAPAPLSAVCPLPSDGGPGCNFLNVAQASTPLGVITLDRGFVGVDVTLGGRTFRIVNVHLEVESLSASPMAPFYQAAQATELKAVLDATSAGVSLIVTGDINSTPVDPRFPDPQNGPLVRPFQQFVEGVDLYGTPTSGGPYLDTWRLRPGSPAGYTCCDDNLMSDSLALRERKDVMFTRDVPLGLRANVFGIDPEDRTPSGLWPSDHAGLLVRFAF
jgi:hypothetical protein